MKKILITGATGKLGTSVVNELISKKGSDNVSVLVRDPSKAGNLKERGLQLVQGNYNNYDSLVKAFKGIDKLFFISGSDVLNRSTQHENIVNAAKEAKVGHIIYTSFQRKTDDETSPIAFVASAHILAEKLIRASGLRYTILKHALYADVVPMFIGDQVLNSGVIFLPAGNGKSSYTSRTDMASAGVAVLTGVGHENKTYEISVNVSYSFYDIADILTELSGKKISYTAPDVETFSTTLAKAGVSADAIQGTTAFCLAIAQGEFDFPYNTLEKLIGRKPQRLKEFLKNAYKL
jgi:NAD(P)H dehydrogenase (quinone)